MSTRKLLTGIALLALLAPIGCAVGGATRIAPESHFVFPNSNIKAMGPVSATLQGPPTLFIPPPLRTAEIDKRLYETALAQMQDADLIIDYVVSTEITMIPIPYIQVYLTKHTIEGTAAQMRVGRQRLR